MWRKGFWLERQSGGNIQEASFPGSSSCLSRSVITQHLPWGTLFESLEETSWVRIWHRDYCFQLLYLERQHIKKSCDLRCCYVENITLFPSRQTQRLATQASPTTDKWSQTFQSKSPDAFRLLSVDSSSCLQSPLSHHLSYLLFVFQYYKTIFCSLPGLCRPTRCPQRKPGLMLLGRCPDVSDLDLIPLKQSFLAALARLLSLPSVPECQSVPGKH